jgi:hypothetical protein
MPVNLNGMDPRVLAALRKIQADAAARGIQTNVISGVRSYQDQVELAANAEADRTGQPLPYPARGHVPLAAAPGTSEHEKGFAFDLQAKDPSRQQELWSIAPNYGLRVIGAKDPNHFELASANIMPARPGTPQTGNPSNPIYTGLIARGYTPPQAYALMGNMQQESNFSPGANNEKEGAYGLLQWRQDRRANLENFARSQGKPVNDLDTQLDFIRYEQTKGSEAGNASAFLASSDVGSANAALKRYIRYGDNSEGTRLTNPQAFARGKTATPGAAGSASPQTGGDWQSFLGAEPPPEASLGSMLSDAVGPAAAAPRSSSGVQGQIDTPLPPIDFSVAPATEAPEAIGARYAQNKQARALSPLGQLFTLPTIGQPGGAKAPYRPYAPQGIG